MRGRLLTDEATEEERRSRESRIAAEQKLDSMMGQRRDLFQTVHLLSDEILDLQKRRQELNEQAQVLHAGFRDLGNRQRTLRDERGRVLDRLDELTNTLYQKRASIPKGPRGGYRRLGTEIAALEKAQQTKVMSLKDENALIERIRKLRHELTEAEKQESQWMAEEASTADIKKDLEAQRQKLSQITEELDKIRAQRDEQMGKVKGVLVEIGHLLTEIRSKGRLRSETLDKAKTLGEEISTMGKHVLELANESRNRVYEARKSFRDHNDSVRHSFSSREVQERAAEKNLSSLFKNGKIELGLASEVGEWATAQEAESRKRRG